MQTTPRLRAEESAVIAGASTRQRILIGVSGGLDSVSLLHALVSAGYKKLIVVHLNHALRGRAATADANFVQTLAKRLHLDCVTGKTDVSKLARERKLSIETAAREARYAFFAKVARQRRCPSIILAHHADDQVETFLFNLLRGAASGLGGMRPHTIREIDGQRLEIFRPWLGIWREEIEAYAASKKIRHREDATNQSDAHTRNRLRKKVLPMLSKELGRDVRQSLWRAAEVLGAQQEWMDEAASAERDQLYIATLNAMPTALQRHAIHTWLRRHRIPQISFSLVEEIRAIIPPDSRKAKVNLPGGSHARRRQGELFIASPSKSSRTAETPITRQKSPPKKAERFG